MHKEVSVRMNDDNKSEIYNMMSENDKDIFQMKIEIWNLMSENERQKFLKWMSLQLEINYKLLSNKSQYEFLRYYYEHKHSSFLNFILAPVSIIIDIFQTNKKTKSE